MANKDYSCFIMSKFRADRYLNLPNLLPVRIEGNNYTTPTLNQYLHIHQMLQALLRTRGIRLYTCKSFSPGLLQVPLCRPYFCISAVLVLFDNASQEQMVLALIFRLHRLHIPSALHIQFLLPVFLKVSSLYPCAPYASPVRIAETFDRLKLHRPLAL